MARTEVLVVICDKCGKEDADVDNFFHVTVAPINRDTKSNKKMKPKSERDLCLECVGMPAVNREDR